MEDDIDDYTWYLFRSDKDQFIAIADKNLVLVEAPRKCRRFMGLGIHKLIKRFTEEPGWYIRMYSPNNTKGGDSNAASNDIRGSTGSPEKRNEGVPTRLEREGDVADAAGPGREEQNELTLHLHEDRG